MKKTKIKIGRNDPCWCNSGKKFKYCHYGREFEREITRGEIIDYLSNKQLKNTCFHHPVDGANCSGKIIHSHTVSKSGSLKKIAVNGHVLNFKPNINTLFETDGKLEIVQVGVNKASTFPGFLLLSR